MLFRKNNIKFEMSERITIGRDVFFGDSMNPRSESDCVNIPDHEHLVLKSDAGLANEVRAPYRGL